MLLLPRDTLVQSAVLGLHVVRLSVRLSVRIVGGSGPHRLAILETNCTDNYPNTFALRSPKAVHLLPGEHREIRLEVGWEKVACWSTKAAIGRPISEMRTDRRKVTLEGLQELSNALSNDTIHNPVRPPLPQDWGSSPTEKSNRYYQEWEKLRISNLASTFRGSITTTINQPLKILEKGSVSVSRDCPIFSGTPYYLRNG